MVKKSTKIDKSSTYGWPWVFPRVFGGGPAESGSTGGSIRGVEILVKLVKFGIGQKVLVILIWAV